MLLCCSRLAGQASWRLVALEVLAVEAGACVVAAARQEEGQVAEVCWAALMSHWVMSLMSTPFAVGLSMCSA